jgi:hypothetical protein
LLKSAADEDLLVATKMDGFESDGSVKIEFYCLRQAYNIFIIGKGGFGSLSKQSYVMLV